MNADRRTSKAELTSRRLRYFLYSFFALHSSFCVLFFLPGCVTGQSNPAATQPVTYRSLKEATPDYWWNQPGVIHIKGNDFDKLWDACEGELYVRLFPVDRRQYRDGLLTSEPVISKQFFELWRTDAVSVHDVAESSLASIRRTVHFELTRHNDGTFDAVPKVLVERSASAERRLTTITQFRSAFSGGRIDSTPDQGYGSIQDYWYALRRDTDLEKDMAASIQRRLRG